MAARLKELYLKTIVPSLTKEFSYTNAMAVPKIEKICVNIGMGEATQNAKLMDGAVNELSKIASRSRLSSCVRACRSAARLLCAGTGCTNFWIVW
jgi:large subunit ribosomal protein L5